MATGRRAQDGFYGSGGRALYDSGADEDEDEEDEEDGGLAGDDEEWEEGKEEEEESPLARSVVQVGLGLAEIQRGDEQGRIGAGEGVGARGRLFTALVVSCWPHRSL